MEQGQQADMSLSEKPEISLPESYSSSLISEGEIKERFWEDFDGHSLALAPKPKGKDTQGKP